MSDDRQSTSIGSEGAAADPAADSTAERVLTTIGNLTRVSGFMGMKQKACSLVITNRRIICAELTKEKMREIALEARDTAKAEGKGLMGRLGAQMRASSAGHVRYRQMAPEAVLAETPGNFAIERADIGKIKFKSGAVDDQRTIPDSVTIKTSSEKYKFHVGGSLAAAEREFGAAGLV